MYSIFLDENVTKLDKKVTRTSVCAVEVQDMEVIEKVQKLITDIRSDKIRFAKVEKIHFSSLSEDQRARIIEILSKLDVTVRTYVVYSYNVKETEAKIRAVRLTLENLRHIHKGKKINISIEHAAEYTKTEFKELLGTEEANYLICDAFLHVFIGVLDNTSGSQGAQDRMYSLIREKIRLQVFNYGGESVYLRRENRL